MHLNVCEHNIIIIAYSSPVLSKLSKCCESNFAHLVGLPVSHLLPMASTSSLSCAGRERRVLIAA